MAPTNNVPRALELQLTRRSVVCAGLAIAASGVGLRASLSADAENGRSLFAGVNLAGGEFGKLPGTYGTDYTYPAPADIDYYARARFQPHPRTFSLGAIAANARRAFRRRRPGTPHCGR